MQVVRPGLTRYHRVPAKIETRYSFVYSAHSFSDVRGASGSGSIGATFVSVRSKSDSRFFSVRTIEPSYSSEYRLKRSPPLTIHLYRSLNYGRRAKSCNLSCTEFGQFLWYNKYSWRSYFFSFFFLFFFEANCELRGALILWEGLGTLRVFTRATKIDRRRSKRDRANGSIDRQIERGLLDRRRRLDRR